GSLPPGLTLNSSTGAITGTPTATGSFSFVLQVIDNSPTPQLINQNFTLTVAGPVAPNFQRYTIPTSDSLPSAIGAGPDGAMWFAESQGNKIGRISLSGTITEYAIPTADSYPLGIAAGPDGALWFSESDGNNIGRITTTGVISEFPVGSSDPPAGITLGPDGALWFAESESYTFGRIGTSGTVEQFGLPESEFFYNVANTVAGPDGTLWFTDAGNDEIGQMTPSGEVTEFPIPTPNSSPSGIAAGPDGALWFTESDPVANKIGRITTTGVITEYPIPTANSSPTGIVVGPDGALWFTETNANSIGRITTSGVITEFAIPGASGPIAIALGSDGALWFTTNANTVGRLSLVGALGLTCDFSAQARANAVYSANCTASNGANPYTYSITAGTLPPGLSLNASTGAITGTPASVGVFSFTVQATDNSSPTQTATYATSSFVVLPPVLVLTCTAPSSAQAETAYSGSCAASGGTPPYTFSVGSGTLPPGLSFSATGTLVGTPRRSGTYSFSLQVTDSESPVQLAAQSLSITVAPPPLRIATAAAPNGTVGLAYSLTLLARHGAAPYTWAITSGSLPAGLSLNTTAGTITGVSRTAGSSTFTIKVADSSSSSQAVSQAFTISIIAGLTITTTALPNGTSGIPYSASVAAQSGTAPYTWSIAAGALPSGLTLNAATGIITGTPTASGSFPFTLKVTDSSTPSLASTQPLSIYITPPIAEPVRPTFSLCASSTESSVCAPLPAAQPPAKAINVTTQLNEPTSVAISGTLTLTFAPNAADLPAGYMDPALQFVDPTGKQLGTTYIFTVPPMATSVSLPDIQPGTVAGAITVTMIVGGQESAASTITVEPLAPVIESNSVQILNITANGFDVELIANSTPRDMTTATLTFAAASGTQIIGNATFSIDISSALAQWYSSTQGQSYGSQFALTIPFTFSGNMSALQSVTATLTNSIGTSSSITGSQ
ncbi:MAG TPA: putative Ig domain-containing protein, partial [Bryobacteraceae bacterium]|nr:putative Ig domain-containing protein [Bryobacteraceae bacterium]